MIGKIIMKKWETGMMDIGLVVQMSIVHGMYWIIVIKIKENAAAFPWKLLGSYQ